MALIEFDYCVVDTETTGGKADINRLIEIAAFHVRDGVVFVAHNAMFDYRFIQCEFARLAQAFPKKNLPPRRNCARLSRWKPSLKPGKKP